MTTPGKDVEALLLDRFVCLAAALASRASEVPDPAFGSRPRAVYGVARGP